MSLSISQNEATPRAKNSAIKPLPRASFTNANPLSRPQPGLTSDQVRFGEKARKASTAEPSTKPDKAAKPAQAADIESKGRKTSRGGQPNGDHRAYGHVENNLREAARIVLCDIAPLALSVLPLVGIPGVGFAFALASLPMSYLSGKLGRRLARDVNPDDLNPAFQYLHKVKHALTSKQSDGGNVVDKINQATDDLLNVRNMPAIFSTTLLPMLKVKPDSGVAKLLTKMNSMALMRAEVNIRLAQAENRKDAGKAMFNGVKDFTVYSAMNKLGTALSTSSIPGAKVAGQFLKNAAWVKIAADLLKSREANGKTAPAAPNAADGGPDRAASSG